MSDSDTNGGIKMSTFNLNSLLNEVSKGEKKGNTLKVIPISIHDIEPSEDNFYSVKEIEELKDAIEMFGIKQNLSVREKGNGKYKLIAGHRRRLASLALVEEGKDEFEYVPCSVETELDHVKEKLMLILTNSTARQLTDWEKTLQAEQMKEVLEEYKKKEKLTGRVRELVAKFLKTSTTQVGRMESISKNLSNDFKEEFKEQNINISTAYELSTLPNENQKEAYEDYSKKGSLSIKDVKDKKKEVKEEVIKNPKISEPVHQNQTAESTSVNEKIFEIRIVTEDIPKEYLKLIEKEGMTMKKIISKLISEKFGLEEVSYSVEEI